MPDINGELPPWLQRNLAYREPFDPTPWLQERYRRQVQAQTLPLQIQGMQLQNQAAQLGIEHQGILNDMQGMQLSQYKDELPRFKQAVADTNGDPVALMNRVESFQSPVLQQQWTNLQKSAAQTSLGLAHNEQIKGDFQAAADLVRKGMPPPEINPDGTINRQSLAETAQAYQQYSIQQARIKTDWHYDENGNPIHGGASSLSAAEKNDQLLTSLMDERDAALDSGDEPKARRLQERLNFLRSQHRNPALEAKLGSLRSEKSKVAEQMTLYKSDNPRYKELKKRYDEIGQEMDSLDPSKSQMVAPSAAPAGEEMSIGRFKVRVK